MSKPWPLFRNISILSVACFSMAVQAETLQIDGFYPAHEIGLEPIRTISIDSFGGADGSALSFELEEQLTNIVVEQERYFNVVAARSSVKPDAVISGTVSVGVDEFETVEYRDRCIEENDKGKCVKRKNIRVICDKRTIEYRAQIRLSRYHDGRTIYTRAIPQQDVQTICADYENFNSIETILRAMIADTAHAIRRDIAPIEQTRNIRILESRKGMDKASSKYFKAAIKMTKLDEKEACRMWHESATNGLVHVSLSFNLGLCAEQVGQLEAAAAFYRDAQQFGSRKTEIRKSLDRIADRMRAQKEWEFRNLAFSDKAS